MDEISFYTREDGETLPLFATPKDGKTSVDFLTNWIAENRDALQDKIREHGAVLFRGFDIESPQDFERVALSYQPELSTEYRGTSPRKLQPGTKAVFSASELPYYFPIGQHLEMSFLPAPPKEIFFSCLIPPVSIGGETTLCDFSKVYRDLDPEVRERFEKKGVMYVRNYTRSSRSFSIDPTMMKGWEDTFYSPDKALVEDECRKSNIDFNWYGAQKDSLKMTNREEAIQHHPETNVPVWFNHVQVFSMPMARKYVQFHCTRAKSLFFYFVYVFVSILAWLGSFIKPQNLGFTTLYGDGTVVSGADLKCVNDAISKNLVFNRWQKGDTIFIDNFRISHGRQPYRGKRKVVVSWSKPCSKPKAFSERA